VTWTSRDIPDLTGRHALVTGANSGLGFHTALELARHGARVTMTARDSARGAAALEQVRQSLASTPGAGEVALAPLDLADLSSVAALAESVESDRLDVLVNNAGVMAIPRRTTADGFEMQLGTNHLGHMALTLRLLPTLVRTARGSRTTRVVTVSSGAHRFGRIDLDDLMGEKRYQPWRAYGQSKLANLLFTAELQRRLTTADLPVAAYAAHPGYASTNLQHVAPEMTSSSLGKRFADLGNSVLAQSAEMGALPTLFAATEPGVAPGSFVGPDGFMEQRGHPRVVVPNGAARDMTMAARLWDRSEALIGISWADALADLPA
jgi:NAD(P)-dependent dehydrogenase (short-subunit alcohol dehydrogenase family)